jgi:hypothetical protein
MVDPTSLDFGSVPIGDSADLTLDISNTGGGTLSGTISESCDDYYIIGDASYSLGSAEIKQFTIRFKPTTVGVINCTIETGNDACSDVSCTGTGEEPPPVCDVDPTSLDFGSVPVGDSVDLTFTISNNGGGTLSGTASESCDDYYLVGDASYSLGSGESKEFTVRFKPLSDGVKLCTIETGEDACVDVSCTGVGGEAPPCLVEPTALDFGHLMLGDEVDLTFTITNTGGGTLVGEVSESCPYYEIVGDSSYELSAGQFKTFTVRFKPSFSGVENCIIETGNGACEDVSCTGSAEHPPTCLVDPTELYFGAVAIGDSMDMTFVICNPCAGTLQGTVTLDCEDFELIGDRCYMLPGGQRKEFKVRFKPTSPGDKDCVINTGHDQCDGVYAYGTGEAGGGDFTISVDPGYQVMPAGDNAGFTVQLTALDGFDQSCTLMVSGLPDPPNNGVFDRAVLVPTDMTTLNVYTTQQTEPGEYDLTITAVPLSGGKPDGAGHGLNVLLKVESSTDADDWDDNPNSPYGFALFQNHPNPFNPETQIGFKLSTDSQVKINIYNVAGRLVKTYQGYYSSGYNSISWDGTDMSGRDVASGVYFYRMEAQGFSDQKRMVLMR